MLTTDIKKKIDSARDILVGKVPDPKAQVEQITTALIYKFMDDMDKRAASLPKGKAQFFTNGFEKYAWGKMMDAKLGGQERLNLYVEAITKMSKNPHLPQLFRDVFKDAFLPYRDPETLNLFLKDINFFNYDHSENLGDAFEYLLSILGSQGDAGQFRTPRHIIDFIVEVVDPKKDETILDPACGTAGFLISAYKHILKSNKNKPLTPDEKKRLMGNLTGYDISPDMVKLSLVNLYLHGFPSPNIHEYDTLTSEEKWDERFDVMMANPPFMTPKGGIRPHKRFMAQANRAEVLFVDYIMEHLNNKGRAGIIVPEAIIFQVAGAYKQLRKLLVEDGLYAVVSLPSGVFNPYSGVRTSILFFDNQLSKQSNEVLFIKVLNDGFDLGAQRRPVDRNDLPHAIEVLQAQRNAITTGKKNPLLKKGSLFAWTALKTKIAENENYDLSGDHYRAVVGNNNTKWQMVSLGEILDYEQPTKYIVRSVDYDDSYTTPVLTAGKTFILGHTNEKDGIFKEKLPVIIFDDFTTAIKFVDFPFKVKSSAMKILHAKENVADIGFLFYVMQKIGSVSHKHKRYWISEYSKIKIPLPPIEVQREIVGEINNYQKVIDGAKQIIEHSKSSIKVNPNWKKVSLKEVCEINPAKSEVKKISGTTQVSFVPMADIEEHQKFFYPKETKPLKDVIKSYTYFRDNDVLLAKITPCFENGKAGIAKNLTNGIGFGSTEFFVLRSTEKILPELLYYYIAEDRFLKMGKNNMTGSAGQQRLTNNFVSNYSILLPPIEEQTKIVSEIENESKHVESAKRMIEIYEEKIKAKIAEVWGE
ncbi:MAG: N-6 DNA methylase [Candidatus Pacebacteria bacterium]|nr:N-6 DNA methylase [Candidatus Paceibacterota bacterium]